MSTDGQHQVVHVNDGDSIKRANELLGKGWMVHQAHHMPGHSGLVFVLSRSDEAEEAACECDWPGCEQPQTHNVVSRGETALLLCTAHLEELRELGGSMSSARRSGT